MRKSGIIQKNQERSVEDFVAKAIAIAIAIATSKSAANLVGAKRKAAACFFKRLREITRAQLEEETHELFSAEIEVDESYFGGVHKEKETVEAQGKHQHLTF